MPRKRKSEDGVQTASEGQSEPAGGASTSILEPRGALSGSPPNSSSPFLGQEALQTPPTPPPRNQRVSDVHIAIHQSPRTAIQFGKGPCEGYSSEIPGAWCGLEASPVPSLPSSPRNLAGAFLSQALAVGSAPLAVGPHPAPQVAFGGAQHLAQTTMVVQLPAGRSVKIGDVMVEAVGPALGSFSAPPSPVVAQQPMCFSSFLPQEPSVISPPHPPAAGETAPASSFQRLDLLPAPSHFFSLPKAMSFPPPEDERLSEQLALAPDAGALAGSALDSKIADEGRLPTFARLGTADVGDLLDDLVRFPSLFGVEPSLVQQESAAGPGEGGNPTIKFNAARKGSSKELVSIETPGYSDLQEHFNLHQ